MTNFQLIPNGNTDWAFYARNGGLFLSDRLPEDRFLIINFFGNGGIQEQPFSATLYLAQSNHVIESNLPNKLAFVTALLKYGSHTVVYRDYKKNKASHLLKRVKDYANEYIQLSGISKQ